MSFLGITYIVVCVTGPYKSVGHVIKRLRFVSFSFSNRKSKSLGGYDVRETCNDPSTKYAIRRNSKELLDENIDPHSPDWINHLALQSSPWHTKKISISNPMMTDLHVSL